MDNTISRGRLSQFRSPESITGGSDDSIQKLGLEDCEKMIDFRKGKRVALVIQLSWLTYLCEKEKREMG